MYRYLHQLLEAQDWLRGEPVVTVTTRHSISSQARRKFIEQKGARCANCGTMENLTVDHKLARALGGTNARGNLQVLCKGCNWEKADEERQLVTLLTTPEGRAELLRQWAELVRTQVARSKVTRTERQAQREQALRLIEANRRAGQYQ